MKDLERALRAELARLRESVRLVVGEHRSAEVTSRAADVVVQATEALHGEIQMALAERRARQIAQIQGALDQLARGEYGQCRDCEEFIGLARLKALPFAQRCRDCQARTERRAQQLEPFPVERLPEVA
jgi:DnaK suppressor protein